MHQLESWQDPKVATAEIDYLLNGPALRVFHQSVVDRHGYPPMTDKATLHRFEATAGMNSPPPTYAVATSPGFASPPASLQVPLLSTPVSLLSPVPSPGTSTVGTPSSAPFGTSEYNHSFVVPSSAVPLQHPFPPGFVCPWGATPSPSDCHLFDPVTGSFYIHPGSAPPPSHVVSSSNNSFGNPNNTFATNCAFSPNHLSAAS